MAPMKNRYAFLAVALLAASLCVAQTKRASDNDKLLIDNSRATWEAYKNRDIAAIKSLTADEYVSYSQTGPSNLQQDIETIGKLTIESFTIDEPKVTWATKDVGILRYRCNLKGSFEGKPFKPVYATEVWVNRGGKWRIISYSETVVS
jgi:hypothetical protein